MKGKCKRASLSWKLLTKSKLLRARTLVSSCDKALVRKFLIMESSEKISRKRQVVRGLKGEGLLPLNYVCWQHCAIFGESLLVFVIYS